MAISMVLRLCLGLIGLAGIGSAAGVPIALYARKDRNARPTHGGGRSSQVSVSECSSPRAEGSSTVSFGAEKVNSVCWEADSDNKAIENSELYTSLFQSQWGLKDKSWNQGVENTHWMRQCIGAEQTSQWALFVQNKGSYLGWCDNSDFEKTSFVKKEEKVVGDTIVWTVSICSGNCWILGEEGTIGNNPKILQQESGENWKEVKFFN